MTCLVKICGITSIEDAKNSVKERADWLGFIFVQTSPRNISPENAKKIIESLPDSVKKVGVFQNEDLETVQNIASRLHLNYVQLHGQESPDYCSQVGIPIIKVLELNGDANDLADFASKCKSYEKVAEIILVDRPKGALKTGHDWLKSSVSFLKAQKVSDLPLVIAGGLNSENIRFVINELSPFGIDCASGVEVSPGVKDQTKLRQFMTAVKGEPVS